MNDHQYEGMCAGCRSDRICGVQQYNQLLIPSCPCRKCLIKGICISTCPDYKAIAHPIFNFGDIKYSGMEDKKL